MTRRIQILLAGIQAALRRLREPGVDRYRLVRRLDALRFEVNESIRELSVRVMP